jgi:hypothetical protein
MKAMEIDSSSWTDEMIENAVRKLEELGYSQKIYTTETAWQSISVYSSGSFELFDDGGLLVNDDDLTPTYEQLMAMTKEDVA